MPWVLLLMPCFGHLAHPETLWYCSADVTNRQGCLELRTQSLTYDQFMEAVDFVREGKGWVRATCDAEGGN